MSVAPIHPSPWTSNTTNTDDDILTAVLPFTLTMQQKEMTLTNDIAWAHRQVRQSLSSRSRLFDSLPSFCSLPRHSYPSQMIVLPPRVLFSHSFTSTALSPSSAACLDSGNGSRDNFVEMEGYCTSTPISLTISFITLMSVFQRLLPDQSLAGDLLSFHKAFWGNPLPGEQLTLKAHVNDDVHDGDDDNDENDESDGDLLPEESNPILKSDWKNLLIRSDYLRIYDFVASADQPGKHLVVVTGQPGIGKHSVATVIYLCSDAACL